ncbi:hypothetical protein BC628DRAFT_625022 [Trametes gibbosa]|nr:hypothetical protein BC628DRAFT_625022 [Trametes gibbosa]
MSSHRPRRAAPQPPAHPLMVPRTSPRPCLRTLMDGRRTSSHRLRLPAQWTPHPVFASARSWTPRRTSSHQPRLPAPRTPHTVLASARSWTPRWPDVIAPTSSCSAADLGMLFARLRAPNGIDGPSTSPSAHTRHPTYHISWPPLRAGIVAVSSYS